MIMNDYDNNKDDDNNNCEINEFVDDGTTAWKYMNFPVDAIFIYLPVQS